MEILFFIFLFITLQIQISDLIYSKGWHLFCFASRCPAAGPFWSSLSWFLSKILKKHLKHRTGEKWKMCLITTAMAAMIKCALIKSNDISAGKCGAVFIFINKAWQTFFKGLVYGFAVYKTAQASYSLRPGWRISLPLRCVVTMASTSKD